MKEIFVICVIKPPLDEPLWRKNYENYGNFFPFLLGVLSSYLRLKGRFACKESAKNAFVCKHYFVSLRQIKDEEEVNRETMSKKTISTALLAFLALSGYADNNRMTNRTNGSITFAVDENLAPVEESYMNMYTGESIAKFMLSEEQIPNEAQRIVATSFSGENNFMPMGKDAFYRSIVDAYANHRSVLLSPDMVWLVISQGFARYVNAHAEELRPKLVSHNGKMDLAILTKKDLLTEDIDWPSLINDFSSQINKYTKNGIAETITSDFTTTGSVERVASQITLMESVKSYFEYIVYRIACGIPTITLQGTAEDWQRVLEKSRLLKQYGLETWINELEPILQEFIQAANGRPNQAFWKSMVKKQTIAELKGGACSPDEPTELDGWLLKLFPDENGKTLDRAKHTTKMPSEYVRVNFKYRVVNPADGSLISETPMELWAGFIGAKYDTASNMLTPKMGWIVRMAESNEDTLNELKKNNTDWGIHLRIQEVPEMLLQLGHIKKLELVFTGKVVLPEWMDKLTIDRFTIKGDMNNSEKAAIRKRFPNVVF